MSQLKRAKERLMKTSNYKSVAGDEDGEWTDKTFSRSPHAQSIPKLHGRNIMEERYSETDSNMQDGFSEYSPDLTKTDRMGRKRINQGGDNMSERLNLFQKQPVKVPRRGTQFFRVTEDGDVRSNIDFSEKQASVYNQSPAKIIKNTIHPTTLSLVISNPPIRKAISPPKPKECSKEITESLIREEKSNHNNFQDSMFPPKFSIVFNKKYMYLEEGLKFQRISKIYEGSKYRLIKFCEPTFLVPGKFTSPSVYSALSILAAEPSRILNLISSQEHNQNGVYYVNLCKDGIWRYIIIDDFFPVKILLRRSLLFLHSIAKDNTHEFWASVVEKALAKMYGTYQDLFLTADEGIEPIMRALTGYPVSIYELNKDFRAFLILIDSALKKKQIVVLENIEPEYRETGHLKKIEFAQSYEIIQVKKSYIVIRNLSEKQLTTKLTFDEVLIFQRLLIFRNENNYTYISYKLRHKKGYYSLLKVHVPERTKCYFDVWENNAAYYKNHIGSKIQYSKSFYKIIVKPEVSEEQTYDSTGQQTMISESGKEIQLRKGSYSVQIHLCQAFERDFVVSYYGESEAKLQRVRNYEKWTLSCVC